jgi:segregation and condensation protein B
VSKTITDQQLKKLIEASIFVSSEPVAISDLFETVLDGYGLTRRKVKNVINELQHDYTDRGINLLEVASGYSFKTTPEINDPLAAIWSETAPKYSRALLETIALIAYKQPITRSEIEAVRGVSVSQTIMHTLKEREWVKVIGYKEVPGRPSLYGTTKHFLNYFQIKSLSELPDLMQATEESILKRPEQLDMDIAHQEAKKASDTPKDLTPPTNDTVSLD